MSEEKPPAKTPGSGAAGPMVPRWLVTVAFVALLGAMFYSATRNDYKAMIVSAVVILFILGADIGSLLRSWRGGGG